MVLPLGPCPQVMAHRIYPEVGSYLAPGSIPLFISDGLDHYFYALTAYFGQWGQQVGERKRQWQVSPQLWYGQVKKNYRHQRLVRVEYRMRLGQLSELIAKVQELNRGHTLNTAFVNRSI